MQRPHGAPVAQRRANILQVREQHVRGRVSQTRDAQVVGHHAHVGGYGGELLGVHRVVLARIDEHHGVADARRVEGKRRHLGHRRRKIEQHRAAAGTGQLVLNARQGQRHGIQGNEAIPLPFCSVLARRRRWHAREGPGAEQPL